MRPEATFAEITAKSAYRARRHASDIPGIPGAAPGSGTPGPADSDPAQDLDRRIALFGPLADLLGTSSRRYNGSSSTAATHALFSTRGDTLENRCDCTMEFSRTTNESHDNVCALWAEPTFWDGDDYWDGEAGRLATSPLGLNAALTAQNTYDYPANPYEHAEDYIWDGDTPVVLKTTAEARTSAPAVCEQEDEAVAAMVEGTQPDEYGWVKLPDGSWADMENRVTYRAIKDDAGNDCWVEELWDDPSIDLQTGEIAECRCTPSKKYWCTVCGVTRNDPADAWRFQTKRDLDDFDASWGTTNTCSHALDPVVLKGVTVYASKVRTHTAATTPDLGCYAYNGWNPSSPAIFIPWQDYGLPTCTFTQAARSIKLAFEAAKEGDVVEMGCMGGHGRTGTILACMAILADPTLTGPEAVTLIKTTYCSKAVETSSQEWFVRWFRAWSLGEAFLETEPVAAWQGGTSKGAPKMTTFGKDGTKEEIYADGTIVTTVLNDLEDKGVIASATPKGGTSTREPSPVWCSDCRRVVYSFHNTSCKFEVPDYVNPYTPTPQDGNVAPGATANARRRAEKRANRAEGAKRAKTRKEETYRNTPTSAR